MLDAFGQPQSAVVLGGTSDLTCALDIVSVTRTVDECFDAADLVLLAVGVLSHQRDELDPLRTAEIVTVTYSWPAVALTRAAARMAEQGFGRIVVVSSVAAVRVPRQNFVYASAK